MSIAGFDSLQQKQRLGLDVLPVWLWFGAGVYILLLLFGNGLLNDSDTFWQIAVGQSIIDHHTLPQIDIYSFTKHGAPWISSSWLAQVMYAAVFSIGGWCGPVVLASAAVGVTFALFVRNLSKRFAVTYALATALAVLLLCIQHFLARPHVLAMPVMVAWVSGLGAAADDRQAPSFWLLPLITLWSNLHGGFVLGLMLIGPFALEALWGAEASRRKALLLNWAVFGVGALAASCLTPYGWNSLLAARSILNLGEVLTIISEWLPVNFSHLGLFEACLLGLIGAALYRGLVLSPPRILLVLGLLHMALSHTRNIEVFALLMPLVVAKPIADQFRLSGTAFGLSSPRRVASFAVAALLGVCSLVFAANRQFTPTPAQSPSAAIDILQQRKAEHILHEVSFGGYLISRGMPVFIDGRAELYGEKFIMTFFRALQLQNVDQFLGLLTTYNIDATLLEPGTPAVSLLDHLDGWQRVYADSTAVVHVRKAGANPNDPKIRPATN